MSSLSIGATGMQAQQLNVDVISNNIANMTTTGYKRHRAEFQDLLYQSLRRVGAASSDQGTIVPAGVQLGAGVQAAAVARINQQGAIQFTDNPLDVAIDGEGFFVVNLPNGEQAYTRSGSFQLSPDGEIVTPDGFLVQGPGAVPADAVEVSINDFGDVLVGLDGQVEPVALGQFELVRFANVAGLEAAGNNLLRQTPASGDPQAATPGTNGYGFLIQGALEQSNVNIVREITSLIQAQRAYEMNARVITTSDQMLQQVSNLR